MDQSVEISLMHSPGVLPKKKENAPSRSSVLRRCLKRPTWLVWDGGRAFCYAGPSAWNALPDFL